MGNPTEKERVGEILGGGKVDISVHVSWQGDGGGSS